MPKRDQKAPQGPPVDVMEHIVGQGGGIFWRIDPKEFLCQFVSRQAEAALGYPAGYWTSEQRPWLDLLHADDRESVRKILEESAREGKDCDVNCRATKADGIVASLRFMVHPVRDEKTNRVSHLWCLSVDITQRVARREQEISQYQTHLEDIVAAASDAIITIDSRQNIVTFNKGAEDIFGCTADQMLGKQIVNFIPAGFRDHHASWVNSFGAKEGALRRMGASREVVALRADGSEFQAEAAISKIEHNGERFYTVILRDITEQRRTQEMLTKFSSAVQQTADSVIITNRDGVIEYVNPAFEKMTGYTAQEVIGSTPRILKSGQMDPKIYDELWQTILDGKPYSNLFSNRKKNGEVYYEEKTVSPLKNSKNKITHFLSAGRDKTERQKAEEQERRLRFAVENAVKEWKQTFDAVDYAIVMLDGADRIMRLNQAAREAIGLDFDEIIGRRLDSFVETEPWKSANDLVKELRRVGQANSRQVRDPISRKHWNLTVTHFWDSSQYNERLILTGRDVTRTVELQDSLRRSETMSAMGTLVAGVAHEVRNPLFGISAVLDAFDERFGANGEYREYIQLLHGELDRVNGIMEALLNYGRPAGVNLAEDDIQPVLVEAIRSCRALATKAEVEILQRIQPGLPRLRMDARSLVEVFRNLLDNAVQYSKKGDVIVFEVSRDIQESEEWIHCSVKDNGPGFATEDIPHLFKPFYSRRNGGTGLGLAIVERIVLEHAGRVVLQNRPGGGGEVQVRLRVRPPAGPE